MLVYGAHEVDEGDICPCNGVNRYRSALWIQCPDAISRKMEDDGEDACVGHDYDDADDADDADDYDNADDADDADDAEDTYNADDAYNAEADDRSCVGHWEAWEGRFQVFFNSQSYHCQQSR